MITSWVALCRRAKVFDANFAENCFDLPRFCICAASADLDWLDETDCVEAYDGAGVLRQCEQMEGH